MIIFFIPFSGFFCFEDFYMFEEIYAYFFSKLINYRALLRDNYYTTI